MNPAYYVISSTDWNSAMDSLGWAFLLCMFMVWAVGVDWWFWYDRLRIELRRRRLRRIRAAREGRP